jgi:hemolysin activation/secretion protein
MHAKKLIIILFFIFLGTSIEINLFAFAFAESVSPSQIQREQEILEKEKALREKIEKKEEKIFIKKILIKGIRLLTEDQIKEIILPFQEKWLTKKDIQQLIDLIIQAYHQKGYNESDLKISYEIKKKCLKIQVEELTHIKRGL